MHPAKSVIFFTMFSGLGLGLMNIAFASILAGHDSSIATRTILILGMLALAGGLVCSLWHLGHPERAWRALSQWRSSWLSREGVMACAAFIPPLTWLGLDYFMPSLRSNSEAYIAGAGIIINIITLHCTAMIYASLKPIPAWHNFYTPLNYQLLSLMSGTIVALWLLNLYGVYAPMMYILAIIIVVIAALAKIGYWRFLRMSKVSFNINQALGVANGADIRAFDPPHSGRNYLMKEMMFDFARQRTRSLQIYALLFGFAVPLLYSFYNLLGWGGEAWLGMLLGAIANVTLLVGLFVGLFCERWLFFACAEHSVSLYYGVKQV